MLKYRWMNAARFAFLLAPTAASSAVMQVPIFCPRMMGIATPQVTDPVTESACSTPTEAEELCMMAVSKAPVTSLIGVGEEEKNLRRGLEQDVVYRLDIVSIPNIKVAKPSRIRPMSLHILLNT